MSVTIRMYNAGFGDCFLITIPAPDRPRRILVDCGKHALASPFVQGGGHNWFPTFGDRLSQIPGFEICNGELRELSSGL